MRFGFDFYRDDSIEDLDERIAKINSFLAERVDIETTHRHFGIFLLPPNKPTSLLSTSSLMSLFKEPSELPTDIDVDSLSYMPELASKQSKTNYRLCIEFFEDDNSSFKPELELLYDLGKTPELYESMQTDVSGVSYLCAYPEREEVQFFKSSESISILFKFKDNDPNIQRIKNHLEFLIPNNSIRHS